MHLEQPETPGAAIHNLWGYRFPAGLGLVLLLCAHPNQNLSAQYCRWVDDKGTVHYDQQCPETADGQPLTLAPPPPAASVDAAENRSRQQREALNADRESAAASSGLDEAGENRGQKSLAEEDVVCPRGNLTRFVRTMEQRCEAERSKLIAPIRQREMDQCMEKLMDRARCERELADLFNPNYVGRLEPRPFDYLPECVTARVCRERAGLEDNSYRGRWYRSEEPGE